VTSLRAKSFIVPVLSAVTLLCVSEGLFPDSYLFREVLTTARVNLFGSISKLVCLATGAVFAARGVANLQKDNPVWLAWALMTGMLSCFAVGQSVFIFYLHVLHARLPLPSVGDLFWVIGYGLMIAASIRFIRVYLASGLPLGRRFELPVIACTSAVVFAVVGYLVLAPATTAAKPWGERLIDVGYPVIDFISLVPVMLLLRITSHFRGGRIWAVWASLLGGLVLCSGGDILFAYEAALEEAAFVPLLNGFYIGGYFLLACGVAQQYELLTD
jgi:hypothetical protein